MEGVACFFFEQKGFEICIAWLRESRSDLYLFPGLGLDLGRDVHNGLPGQAVLKNKNEVMIKKSLI
jgi:hypothetical protein